MNNNDNLIKQEKVITKILIMECVTAIPSIVIAVSSNSLVLLLDIVDYAMSISLHAMAIVILRKSRESHEGIYDYGLGKFESLLSLAIAGTLLMGLLLLLGMAAHRFFVPVDVKPLFAYLGIASKAFFFGMNTYFAVSERDALQWIDGRTLVNQIVLSHPSRPRNIPFGCAGIEG